MLARVAPRTKLVCLISPHNPTGTAAVPASVGALLPPAVRRRLVLLDEAYIDFIEAPDRAADGGSPSLAGRPQSLVLLRTFSKITGLAGLRVGYAIAAPR